MFSARSALLALLLFSLPVHAQRNLDIERFRPSPDRDGFLGMPGTRTPGPWNFNASLVIGYESDPLTLRGATGARQSVIGHRFSGDMIAELGILGRFALVIDVPVAFWQDTNASALGGPAIAAVGFRDPYVAARARILGAEAGEDRQRNEGEGFAIQVGGTLPFGLEQAFLGEGNPQLEILGLADFHFFDFAIGAMFGYRHRFADPRLFDVKFSNELLAGVAVQTPTILVPNLVALFEARVVTAVDDSLFGGATSAFEGNAGVRWAENDFALTWAVGMGWSSAVGTPAFRGIFGIEFAPRSHDADRDGIRDEADECPRIPEDMDGFEDENGCPDPDNDGDLVPDEDDHCPNDAAELDRDQDDDGCTDAVVDGDSDGIVGDVDRCPDAPEDRDGFEDEDGCPDPDNDGDAILDAQDRCPREAEDRDEFQDEDGCPDPDNDGDGIADTHDRCPNEPEDRDGVEDEDGCPDP